MSVVTIVGWVFFAGAFIAAMVERRRVRRLRLDQVGRPERLLRTAPTPEVDVVEQAKVPNRRRPPLTSIPGPGTPRLR